MTMEKTLSQKLKSFGKLIQTIGSILSFIVFTVFFIRISISGWQSLEIDWSLAVLVFSAIPVILSFPVTLMKLIGLIIGKKPIEIAPEEIVVQKEKTSKGKSLEDFIE